MLEMVEDLGTREYGTQGFRKRWWLVKCPVCDNLFEAAAPNIKNGNTTRCKACGKKASGATAALKSASNFYKKAITVHGSKYDYSNVEYVTSNTPVIITCTVHGDFKQTPDDHLQGKKCPSCAGRPHKTTTSFRNEVEELTSNEYSIASEYINKSTGVLFKHIPCNNEWITAPNTFLAGMRCPHCKNYKSSPTKPCILYYFKVTYQDQFAWKIGITHTKVSDRYSLEELARITDIVTWEFDTRAKARSMEASILNEFKEFKYEGPPLLQTGNTELFATDILDLIKIRNK